MKAQDLRKHSYLGWRGFWLVAQGEGRALLRNRGLIISQLLEPFLYVVFLVIGLNQEIGLIKFGQKTISYAHYAIVGMLGVLVITQATQTIYRATIDKRYGLMALKMLSGVSPLAYILGMMTMPTIGLILQELLVFLLATLFGVSFPGFVYPLLLVGSWLICLFWSALAILATIGINSYEKRDLLIRFILTPLGFTAPTFYILSSVPKFVQVIAYCNPLTYQLTALRRLAFEYELAGPLGLLGGVALLTILGVTHLIGQLPLVLGERN